MMRIMRVPNQRTLIIVSFNTKSKGAQSQMTHSSATKWARGTAKDSLKAFLESFVHTKTAEVMQDTTRCTQNAICTTSRGSTCNSTIAVTARTALNDQEMHLLGLRWVQGFLGPTLAIWVQSFLRCTQDTAWVQSWRIDDFFSVLLESCSC